MATASERPGIRRRWPLYFPIVTTLLLVLSIAAFWDNLVSDVRQPSNSDPMMIIHGLVALAWMIMFAAQAWLVRAGRTPRHRQIGNWVFAIAAALALSTIYVFYAKFRGFSAMGPEVLANRLLLPVFVGFTLLAYVHRRRADRHKRFLLLGTLALLSPIIARTFDRFFWVVFEDTTASEADLAFSIYFFGAWALLAGSLWAYDFATARRVHPATVGGTAIILSIVLGTELLWSGGQ